MSVEVERDDMVTLVRLVMNYATERPGFYYSRDSDQLDAIRERYGITIEDLERVT